MSNSAIFVKIRAHLTLCFIVLIFPVSVILAIVYRICEFILNYRKFKNIAGDIAVVTGSGHGLGRCIALQLAKRGAHVAVVDINLNGAEETVKLIESKYNVKCKAYKVDVTDYTQVENLNKEIKKDLGVATLLVNNAGIVALSNFAKPSHKEIERMIDVNLKAHFWTNDVFLENMKKCRKGHILAICSIAGMFPLVYNSVYCSTKFGVRGMMRALRLDLKALEFNDIKTTLVCPSFLATNDDVVELVKDVKVEKIYPLLKGEEAARSAVHAMLRNEVEVTLPRGFALLSRIFDFFPAACQDTLWFIINRNFVQNFQKVYKEHEKNISKIE